MTISTIKIMPYVDDGDLVVELLVDGQEVTPVVQTLDQIFEEFLDYRRSKTGSEIDPECREELVNTIAQLRTIARRLEIEVDGMRGYLN